MRTGRLARRRSDERGLALSSPLALLSVAAVVIAAAAFVVTGDGADREEPGQAVRPVTASPTPSPTEASVAPQPVLRKKKQHHKAPPPRPVVHRGDTYVEVYNNSGVSGLAGRTASRAQGAGWQVVGSDNWYGTIAASTVYYPARLRDEAKLLGKDLGIRRLKPAIAPMRGDRLTVILTTDYS